ncbi:VOC family protein [Paenibacillus sp. PL2-23]|uniref:VOC family protein n=1 Tax=Paenibacillus sp. PL2-23 TaxID=2100729 RepID=UPI0030FA5B4D
MSIQLNPYVTLDGTTKEAVYFYEKALGAEIISIMTFGEMPADPNYPLADEVKDRVMHAHLKVGSSDLMFSDTMPGMPHQPGDTISISIQAQDQTRAREIFAALEDGGNVVMPQQKTDWSPLYGMVKDKFGILFQINVPE